jgi:hypothetical protein
VGDALVGHTAGSVSLRVDALFLDRRRPLPALLLD